jgi:hypothetical protein
MTVALAAAVVVVVEEQIFTGLLFYYNIRQASKPRKSRIPTSDKQGNVNVLCHASI